MRYTLPVIDNHGPTRWADMIDLICDGAAVHLSTVVLLKVRYMLIRSRLSYGLAALVAESRN